MYYNTNRETGQNLSNSQAITVSQEERILEYFIISKAYDVAPHHLLGLFQDNTPITSIRRAVTNLERAGKLVKTDVMTKGTYGKMVHTWRIKETQLELWRS